MIDPAPYLLTDDHLLAACQRLNFSGSGPGGQHRNRHAAGIRLRHTQTGCEASCIDHRSLSANQRVALKRLRLQLALHVRGAVNLAEVSPHRRNGRFSLGPNAAHYPQVVAQALNALQAHNGVLRDAAEQLAVSSSQLVKLLVADKAVRQVADAIRAQYDAPPLRN